MRGGEHFLVNIVGYTSPTIHVVALLTNASWPIVASRTVSKRNAIGDDYEH